MWKCTFGWMLTNKHKVECTKLSFTVTSRMSVAQFLSACCPEFRWKDFWSEVKSISCRRIAKLDIFLVGNIIQHVAGTSIWTNWATQIKLWTEIKTLDFGQKTMPFIKANWFYAMAGMCMRQYEMGLNEAKSRKVHEKISSIQETYRWQFTLQSTQWPKECS